VELLEKTIVMARYALLVVLVALLSSTGVTAAPLCEQQRGDGKKPEASATQPDGPPRWKWWLHADSRKELRLTDHQSRKIDEVWESYAPRQRERGQELEKLEQALAQTIKENVADVAVVAQQVEKLEKLRAEYNATRTVMIYRMHLLLTPEQRVKVDEMRARMEAERRKRQEQEEERKRQGRGGEKY
jgi:Spy/CpxP family protein refolding chaperone